MNKPTLVLHHEEWTSFKSDYLEPVWKNYFNIEIFNKNKTYNKNDCIFVVNCFKTNDWVTAFYNEGYKVLIDNLWEAPMRLHKLPNAYTLLNKNWFWYNESLLYKSFQYDYYTPNKTYEKLALMLIRKATHDRTLLFNNLTNHLNNFLYSYVDKNIFMQGEEPTNIQTRHVESSWYDRTCFSLVVESYIRGATVVTEKTFKAIAFKHPFIIYGGYNILSLLRTMGFETYDNLFDETYDKIINVDEKIKKLIDNINNYKNVPYDTITLGKIEHNYNLFYNTSLVLDKVKKEIIDPILEYVEN